MGRAAKGKKPETQSGLKSVPSSWEAAAAGDAGREGSLFRSDSSRASPPRADGPLLCALVWGSPPPPRHSLPQVRPGPRCRQWPGAACWTVRAVPREHLTGSEPKGGFKAEG